jgi:hypothetical protein
LRLVAEGRTVVQKGRENASFYLGNFRAPVAIIKHGEIPDYLTDDFWIKYHIWNNSRLTQSLPLSPVWAENPEYLIEIITAFQNEYEHIMRS